MLTHLPAPMRRRLLGALVALPAAGAGAARPDPDRPDYPVVRSGVPLVFPRDFGAHPDYRTEWWYITGWLQEEGAGAARAGSRDAPAPRLGFQVTFFRSRPQIDPRNPSRFAARQLVLAHVALSDERQRTLVHDQRTARAGFELAGSRTGDTDVWIDDWRLSRQADGDRSRYRAIIPGSRIGFDLTLDSTQPVLLHGVQGFSQKGPQPRQASYYYTQPHLAVSGQVVHESRARRVTGSAWLDHEWSSEIMAAGATGWDWIGINLDDGGALMAFRIRDRSGGTVWAGGSWRDGSGRQRVFDARSVAFSPVRRWRSARTGATYPVAMQVRVTGLAAGAAGQAARDGAGSLTIDLTPMFDDQELDARGSTGIVYWEGAVSATVDGRPLGRGYLELTGYHRAVAL